MHNIYTFLLPIDIPAGKALLLNPDRTMTPIKYVPFWYWESQDRVVGRTDVYLKKDAMVMTYFLCTEDEQGNLFATVYALSNHPRHWRELGRTRTLDEARAFQAAVRKQWWVGPERLRVLEGEPAPLDITLPEPSNY